MALDGRVLVARLDLEGLEVSAGSACASGSLEPSHVLLAIGHTNERARRGLRVSFGRESDDEDVHNAVDILRRTFLSLR
jgi:cysteine desulfurase